MAVEDQQRQFNKVIAKAWLDEEFKKKLMADPTATLKAEGIETPPGVELRIAENTHKVRHFVLPPKPTSDQVSEEVLSRIVKGACECGSCAPTNYQCGGGTYNCASGFCTGGGWCDNCVS